MLFGLMPSFIFSMSSMQVIDVYTNKLSGELKEMFYSSSHITMSSCVLKLVYWQTSMKFV
jgi:hypothetical protein